jgi:hypothetical protein
MRQLKVAPIVEGDGEVPSVPILLRRICSELIPGSVVHVLRPIRQPRQKLLANKDDCLAKALGLAVAKLRQFHVPDADDLILVLLDADDDCAAEVGPAMLAAAESHRGDVDIASVFAVLEYETWFVAAAASLQSHLRLDGLDTLPTDPEGQRCRKGWIKNHFRGPKYSETVDQPKMTAVMDLQLCRQQSPSFDKLCRELESRLK